MLYGRQKLFNLFYAGLYVVSKSETVQACGFMDTSETTVLLPSDSIIILSCL